MWHDVAQNTDDPCPCCGKTWMELRAGKVTGSTIGLIMANYGKAFGDPAKRLATDIATFELGGMMTPNEYKNSHMDRGHEQEPIARMNYEDEYFTTVSNGGFFDNGKTGSSPDGLIGVNGVAEIKSVTNPYHYNCIKLNSFDPKYKWQLFFNLKESGREWIDYISYCSTFPSGKKLFVSRINLSDIEHELNLMEIRLEQFHDFVAAIKNVITKTI